MMTIGISGFLSRRLRCEWRMNYQLGQLAKVLCGCGQRKFVVRAGWTAQPEAIQLQDALQMRKQDLDLFSVAT